MLCRPLGSTRQQLAILSAPRREQMHGVIHPCADDDARQHRRTDVEVQATRTHEAIDRQQREHGGDRCKQPAEQRAEQGDHDHEHQAERHRQTLELILGDALRQPPIEHGRAVDDVSQGACRLASSRDQDSTQVEVEKGSGDTGKGLIGHRKAIDDTLGSSLSRHAAPDLGQRHHQHTGNIVDELSMVTDEIGVRSVGIIFRHRQRFRHSSVDGSLGECRPSCHQRSRKRIDVAVVLLLE